MPCFYTPNNRSSVVVNAYCDVRATVNDAWVNIEWFTKNSANIWTALINSTDDYCQKVGKNFIGILALAERVINDRWPGIIRPCPINVIYNSELDTT